MTVDPGCPCLPTVDTPSSPIVTSPWATYLDANPTEGRIVTASSNTVDSQNNLYVVGTYSSTTQEVTVVNALLNTPWQQIPSPIKLPATGSVQYAFLIKYNSDGVAQWATYFGTTDPVTNQDASFNSVEVDSSDNVIVTGSYTSTVTNTLQNASGTSQTPSSFTLPNTDSEVALLIKYNPSGIAQWATYFGITTGGSSARVRGASIAIDSSDSIYITGSYFYNITPSTTIKLKDASGNTQSDSPITFPSSGVTLLFLLKYQSNGTAVWATYFGNITGGLSNRAQGVSVTVDSVNNIYVTGTYASTSSFFLQNALTINPWQTDSPIEMPARSPEEVLVMKYSSSGVAQWATFFGGNSRDRAVSIRTDSLNNVYVTGGYRGTSSPNTVTLLSALFASPWQGSPSITLPPTAVNNEDLFLVKYNTNGIVQWGVNLKGTSVDTGASIAIDSLDTIYVSGVYTAVLSSIFVRTALPVFPYQQNSSITLPITNGTAICLLKYNSSGVPQSATYLGANATGAGRSIAIDSNNNIYLAGSYISTDTNDVYIQNPLTVLPWQEQSPITLPGLSTTTMCLIKYV